MAGSIPNLSFSNLVPLAESQKIACPECATPMQSFKCRDASVEKCPNCQGIWFSRHGFGVFRNTLQEFDLRNLRMLPREQFQGIEAIAGCPHCQEALSHFRYSYNTKVMLQKCGSCQGVWLPFLELMNLIELTGTVQAIAPHIVAATAELSKMEEERRRSRRISSAATELVKPVRPWRD